MQQIRQELVSFDYDLLHDNRGMICINNSLLAWKLIINPIRKPSTHFMNKHWVTFSMRKLLCQSMIISEAMRAV